MLRAHDPKRRNTLHRRHVDLALSEVPFHGNVLDVGGRKKNKHGQFAPDLSKVTSWKYVNIDAGTDPDYLCSASNIPVPDGSFDMVLLSEVLEHLEEPEASIHEIARVLNPQGGKLVLTMPFLFPLHACPSDYQRWTPEKMRLVLKKAGFTRITVKPLSSFVGVVLDLIWIYFSKTGATSFYGKVVGLIYARLFNLSHDLLLALDGRIKKKDGLTSGYFVIAERGAA